MNPLLSRLLVAALGLPAVLGLVWLGGWWLWLLAMVGGLIALHEFYSIARPLRPLVPAGYVGLVLTLLGAQLGGVVWMVGGFLATRANSLRHEGQLDRPFGPTQLRFSAWQVPRSWRSPVSRTS